MKLDCNWWMDLTVFALGRRSLGYSDGAAGEAAKEGMGVWRGQLVVDRPCVHGIFDFMSIDRVVNAHGEFLCG